MGKKGKNGSQGGTAKAGAGGGRAGKPASTAGAERPGTKGPARASRNRVERERRSSGAWLETVAGIVAGLIVWVVGTGFEARAYAMYFTPRVAVYYPLALLFLLLFVVTRRPGGWSLRVDWLDGLLAAFAGWQVVAALASPSPAMAWFGVLNRGGGSILWISMAALVFAARRILIGRRALVAFVWVSSFTILVAGLAAAIQALGGSFLWGGAEVFWAQGRMTGSSGNPVNLSGLCLFAVWLGAVTLAREDLPSSMRYAATVGAIAGLVGEVLAIGRAGYVGVAVGIVVCATALVMARRWRPLALVGVATVLVLGLTVLYSPSFGGEAGGIASRVEESTVGELSAGDQSRTEFWRIALDAVRERPVTGYGQGAYVIAYRAFVSPETAAAQPNTGVSDPHQVALLLASGSGIPGLLLGAGFMVSALALCVIRFLRRRKQEGAGSSPWGICAPELPCLSYGLAALAFLSVSPVDLVIAAPLGLILGSGLGEPAAGARLAREVRVGRGGQLVTYVLGGVFAAGAVAALVCGVRFLQADMAFGESMRKGTVAEARQAADLMPLIPEYAQVAGGIIWRQGVSGSSAGGGAPAGADADLVMEGEALLVRGVRNEPTSVNLRAELARLYLATKSPAAAAEHAVIALGFSPHQPILQGLLANAVLQAQTELGDKDLAARLLEEAESLSLDSPDGNYWMAQVYASMGDGDRAREAGDTARELAPDLTPEDYVRRVQTGQ